MLHLSIPHGTTRRLFSFASVIAPNMPAKSWSPTDSLSDAEKADFDEHLAHLPETYKEEILRQYDIPQIKSTMLDVLRWATPFEVALMALGGIMAIVAGAALPLTTIIMGNLANVIGGFTVQNPLNVATISSVGVFNYQISQLALKCTYIGIAVLVGNYIAFVTWVTTGERITRRIRGKYLRSVLRQNIAFFDRLGAGEVTNRISNDAELVRDSISEKVPICVSSAACFVSAFVVAFIRQWKYTFILIYIVPLILLIFALGVIFLSKFSKKFVDSLAEAATVAEEIISSIRTVQAYGSYDKLSKLYDTKLKQAELWGFKNQIGAALMIATMYFSVYGSYGLGFWEGSRMIAEGDLNTGHLMTVLWSVIFGAFALGTIGPRIPVFAQGVAAAQDILQTIKRVPCIDSLAEGGERLNEVKGRLEFRGVSFIYPSRPQVTVLRNVSISIPEGKFTALVGVSGSGKSTIIQLLERFYDPIEGDIFLDGANIKSLNVHFLRSQIGYVGQEPVLFGTTIFENVTYGMVGTSLETVSEKVKRDAVQNACKLAGIDPFIRTLPSGYNTLVGERGLLLSGGQKQRIAIARAIVSDPKILLLDEATSSLDTLSERQVQKALDSVSIMRTTICIAHRLSTIKKADKVIVLSHGEVVEEGTHDELYARNGVYHRLVEAQHISAETDEWLEKESESEHSEAYLAHFRSSSSAKLHGLKKPDHRDSFEYQKIMELGVVQQRTYKLRHLIRKAFTFNKSERGWLILGWCLTLITGGVYPAQALLFAYSIYAFMNPDISYMRSQANLYSLCWLVVAIVLFLGYGTYQWSFGYAAQRMARRVRLVCFNSILRQNTAFFDREEHSTGALTSKLASEATDMSNFTGLGLGAVLTVLVGIISGSILGLVIGWKLALVSLATVPLLVVSAYALFHLGDHMQDDVRKASVKSTSLTCEQVAAIRTIAALRREEGLYNDFCQTLDATVRVAMRSTYKSTVFYAISQGLPFWVNALAFWYGSTLIRTGEYSLLQFYICQMAILMGAQGAGQSFSFAPDMTKAKSATVEVSRLLDHQPDIDIWNDDGYPVNVLQESDIQFQDVSFTYPSRPQEVVLKNVTFEIHPGQYVALVGPSGCGKSTIAALLERFYDPTAGEIFVDGIRLSDYRLRDYRRNLAIVSQEPTLYQGTIRFNILIGANSEVTDQELEEVCKSANILEFIQSLPLGYETIVGSRGSTLSGGQKQRIAIARALIRNPKILILDEATSSLDSESEHLVQAAMDQAARAQGRTTLTIAHRLSTIVNADVIYIMDRGRIVEAGTHEELIALKGRYYELARQQELEM